VAAGVWIVTRSVNEVMTLAAKAARGAGAPPAQAAQFGAAAAVHLGAGREIDPLEQALAALPEGPVILLPLALMRIAEQGQGGHISGTVTDADPALLQSYLEALPYAARLADGGLVELYLSRPSARPRLTRIALPDHLFDDWNRLAARLLVPESEASRLSGAGAGLSDND